MAMEWSKSTVSGAELERKRREYIEAAMNMSRRAASEPERSSDGASEEKKEPFSFSEQEAKAPVSFVAATETASVSVEAEAASVSVEAEAAPVSVEAEAAPVSVEAETASYAAPELLHEPEPLIAAVQEAAEPGEEGEETSFGVFDVEELIDAVKRGEVDGEKLREASEILAEMSGKTEEMQRLTERPFAAEHAEEPDGVMPQSLNQSVQRHNGGGSCPRCNGGNRNGPRR